MIGLMELAASQAMHALLGEGELSVEVSIEDTHDAATSISALVSVEAKFVADDEKLLFFEVVARDPGGDTACRRCRGGVARA